MKWFTVSDFLCADEAMLTTTCRGKQVLFVTVLWTLDFLARPILPRNRSYFMAKKKEKQIILKIVRANKLTRQTQQINNDHRDRQEATKNFLIHGQLTEANKALHFFSEGEYFLNYSICGYYSCDDGGRNRAFIVYKYVSWWACGLFSAMTEMTHVSLAMT